MLSFNFLGPKHPGAGSCEPAGAHTEQAEDPLRAWPHARPGRGLEVWLEFLGLPLYILCIYIYTYMYMYTYIYIYI